MAVPKKDKANLFLQTRFGPTKMANQFSISFQQLAVNTATIQISSLVFCLAWSIKFNFYESTATHCRVDNYLPSLSATLDFTPQRDVWRACVGLSGTTRYFIAYLYYKLIFHSKLLLALHWIEVTALIGLSIVDSIRYFGKIYLVYSGQYRAKQPSLKQLTTVQPSLSCILCRDFSFHIHHPHGSSL